MQSRFSNYAPTILDENEHIQLSSDIVSEIKTKFSEDPFYISFTPELSQSIAALVQLTTRVFKSEFTKNVKESDQLRSGLYRSAVRNLKDDVKFRELDSIAGDNAEIVLKVFEEHPVKCDGSYTEESVQLRNLFDALDEVDSSIPKTSAVKRITQLLSEQPKFDEWRKKQTDDQNSKLHGQLYSAIEEVSFKTNAALNYLETQAMVHGGEFETSAQLIEEMIMKIMTPARARKTKHDSDGSEEE